MKTLNLASWAFLSLICLSSITSAGSNKNLETCRAKLKAAKKLDLLYDMKWEKGQAPMVVVGPTYDNLPFDAREGFVETINCFLSAGETGKCFNFDLLDYKTHNAVAQYSNCCLVSN